MDCVWVSPLSLTREPAWVSERVCVCVSSVELRQGKYAALVCVCVCVCVTFFCCGFEIVTCSCFV